MSGRTTTRYMLECDGCGFEMGGSGEYENAVEARADAYGKGWRFPCRTRGDGQKSTRTSDVCPKCLPTFDPSSIPAGDSWKNKRGADGKVIR